MQPIETISAVRFIREAGMVPAVALGLLLGSTPALSGPLKEGAAVLSGGRIGYVVTHRYWSLYETEGAGTECPNGFNDGPREEFKKIYGDGTKRSIVDAQLKWEGVQWHPSSHSYDLPYREAKGKISYGMNLDGKVDAEDFVSPEGERGIDNQYYRSIACIDSYREGGSLYTFENTYLQTYADVRFLIELTGVDDLTNDDDVTVTTYRGVDDLLGGATGTDYLPGGTQRVDTRWSKDYVFAMKGRIVDGVLSTQPIERAMIPWGLTFNVVGRQLIRDMRLRLDLTQERATGLLAGYLDIQTWERTMSRNLATHHASYGRLSVPSVAASMRRNADAYPDDAGKNTAISASLGLQMVQVYVVHPEREEKLMTSTRR